MAFLCEPPATWGHLLVVPREHRRDMHLVPRYADDTVQPGCVWGDPPWEPPAGGDEEPRRVADAIRRGVASRHDSATLP